MYGQYQSTPQTAADGSSAQARIDASRRVIITGEAAAAPVPVASVVPVGGGITWGAPTAVTLTGSSQNLVSANAGRRAIRIINRIGNAQISYDLSGGVVTLIGGDQLVGGQKDWYSGAECPVGVITVIGTAAQLVTVVEGT